MPKTKTWQDNQPQDDTPAIWRNRIVRYGDARVDELLANPFNLRIHGQAQQAYMLGVLKSVGIVDTICINETTGHLVDGHLRMVLADRHGIESLPARWIQVSEAEEAEILLTFDWITTLATYDRDNTDALLRMVQTDEPDVQAMLAGMAEANDLYFGDDIPLATDDNLYSREVEAPIYEPSREKPPVSDLYDNQRANALIAEINACSELSADEKAFMIAAAQRHTVLNFSKIADFYAHSSPTVQHLMENSALVIIDFNRAIELGFVKLTNQIAELESEDNG